MSDPADPADEMEVAVGIDWSDRTVCVRVPRAPANRPDNSFGMEPDEAIAFAGCIIRAAERLLGQN